MNQKKVCNKRSMAAVEGDEYLIPKKYNNDHIPKNKDEKSTGIKIFFCE